MRIAVAASGLDVARQFAQCDSFTCYTVERGIITDCQNTPNPGPPFSLILEYLKALEVSTLIVGLIEEDIATGFCDADIEVVAGVTGNAREVVSQYLTNTLIGVDAMCHDDDDAEDVAED